MSQMFSLAFLALVATSFVSKAIAQAPDESTRQKSEIENLRKQLSNLEKENELLKREMDLTKNKPEANPRRASDSGLEAEPRTKARGGTNYEKDGAGDPPVSGKKELASLAGTWRTVGGEDGGRVIMPDDIKAFGDEYVFKDNTLTFCRRGQVIAEFKVSVNPSRNPKEMDLTIVKGSDDGKMCPAIYSLENDQLKICTAQRFLPDLAAQRPNVFSTQKEQEVSKRSGLLLLVLQRK